MAGDPGHAGSFAQNAEGRVLGYKNVVWYPDGTDRWEAAGLPLPEPARVQ